MKITLKSDEKGFLVGDKIELGGIADNVGAIRDDVSVIRELLEQAKQAAARAKDSPAKSRTGRVKPQSDNNKRPIVIDVKPVLQIDARLAGALPANQKQEPGTGQLTTPRTGTIGQQPALGTAQATAITTPEIQPVNPALVTPTATRERDERGRFISNREAGETGEVSTTEKPGKANPGQKEEAKGNETGRDEKGRFTTRNEDDTPTTLKRIKEGIGKIGDGIESMTDGEDIDPTIQAMGEIHGAMSKMTAVVAAPMHAVDFMFGRGKDKDKDSKRWYQKLYNQLNWMRRDTGLYHQRELAVLRDIEDKPEGGNSGILKYFGLAFAALTAAIGRLAGKLGILSAAKGLGSLIGRRGRGGAVPVPGGADKKQKRTTSQKRDTATVATAGSKKQQDKPDTKPKAPKTSMPGKLGSVSKGLLKRFPWLAAALAGGSVLGNELDPNMSRKEKTLANGQDLGRAGAGLGGAAAGAAIGTAIFPGIGTAAGAIIGGFAGDYFAGEAGEEIGDKVAGWIHNLNMAAIPEAIKIRFGDWVTHLLDTQTGQYLKTRWDEGVALVEKAASILGVGLESLNSWIEQKTGINVKEKANQLAEGASSFYSWVEGKGKQAGGWIAEKASAAYSGVKSAIGLSDAKPAGSNTSPRQSFKSSIRKDKRWKAARENIVNAADEAGVDPGVLAAIAHFESGFNPDAQPIAGKKRAHLNKVRQFDGTMAISSAHGYGQFLDGTWTDYINKYGAKYGVEGAGKLTKKQAAKYRNDTQIQAAMLAELTKENVQRGKRLGGKDDVANVYALHNLGAGDGGKFLKALKRNPHAPVSSVLSGRVIKGNSSLYSKGQITVAEAYARMGKKMRQGEKYAQDARAYAAAKQQPAPARQAQPLTKPPKAAIEQPAKAKPVIAMNPRVQAMSQTYAVRTPKPAKITVPNVKIKDADPVAAPSKKDSKPTVQQPPIPDVDKHLPDPVIAHAISGGMGFGGKNHLLGS